MTQEIILRQEAIKRGVKHYFTGKPCVRGHIAIRDVAWKKCVVCQREKKAEKYASDPEAARKQKYAWRDSHKDIVINNSRDRYVKNRDRLLSEKKQYYVNNREERRAYHKRNYAENSETKRERQIDYRRRNPELVAASYKRWKEAHPEICARHSRANRARRRGAEGSHTVEETNELRKRQRNKCAYCNANLKNKGHLDHIVAISKGGNNYARNLQWLCASCNLHKYTKDAIDFAQSKGLLI